MLPRPPLSWRPILLGVALVAATVWCLRQAPATRLVGSARVFAGTILPANLPQPPTSWDMDLRLDPSVRPPGPSWVLHEGRRPEDGYHLRWLPDRGILQVHRAQPQPALLGSVRVTRPPNRISFRRRGGELTVAVDGRPVLRCLDPLAPSTLAAGDHYWGCTCTSGGDLRDSTLTVQLAPLATPRWGSDGDPGTGSEEMLRRRGDHALLRVRAALMAVATDDPATPARLGAANAALGIARSDLAPLRGSGTQVPDIPGVTEAERTRGTSAEDRVRLTQWLALARVQWWLHQGHRLGDGSLPFHGDHLTLTREALDDLLDLGPTATNAEYPGMLLGLIPRLATLATAVPSRAEDPRRVAERRRRWLDLLATTTESTRALVGADLGSDDLHLLALVAQACATLSAPEPVRPAQPLPVESPAWVKVRWRLLTGDAPDATDLPPLPAGSSGLASSVDVLLGPVQDLNRAQATAEALAALADRDRALAKGLEGQADARAAEDRAARIGDDPRLTPRDRAVGLALVALGIGSNRPSLLLAARERLAPQTILTGRRTTLPKDRTPLPEPVLAEQDPLAWALLRLLIRRHGDLLAPEGAANPAAALPAPDEYATLLSGRAEATSWIWLVRLPPDEALAAALAAQEAGIPRASAGAMPDWSLLAEVPNLGLPLRLLKPRDDRAPGVLDTP